MRSFVLASILTLFLSLPMWIHGKMIEVQGHRGSRGTMPENTVPAFEKAIAAGVDVLELDLLMTKDGKIVIYHDHYLNPDLICRLDGMPYDSRSSLLLSMTLAELKELDCGRKTNSRFPKQKSIPGMQIPTLEELFEMINTSTDPHAKTVRLNLEIKRDPFHPQETIAPSTMAKQLLHLVHTYGFEDRVYYSSFDPDSLKQIRTLSPQAKIAFLREGSMEWLIDIAHWVQAETVSPEHILIHDADQIRSLQHMGFKVILWTVNDPQRWEELILMGVDGIITDYPEELIHFIQKNSNKFTTSEQ